MLHTILRMFDILDICIEHFRCVIIIVPSNRSLPSIEKVDVYIYPQWGSFVQEAIQSIPSVIQSILPNSLFLFL